MEGIGKGFKIENDLEGPYHIECEKGTIKKGNFKETADQTDSCLSVCSYLDFLLGRGERKTVS